jgi:hypothetical protein
VTPIEEPECAYIESREITSPNKGRIYKGDSATSIFRCLFHRCNNITISERINSRTEVLTLLWPFFWLVWSDYEQR